MRRRKTTDADAELSPQQAAALDLMAIGYTVKAAAEAVDVTRQTASEWLNQHAAFRAALNRRRQELWSEASDRLRALVPKALDVLAEELNGPVNRRWAAVQVLRAAGAYGLAAPTGPTDTEAVELEDKAEQDRRMFAAL